MQHSLATGLGPRSEHAFGNWIARIVEQLLEVAPAIVVVLDTEGRILDCNRLLTELTGRSAASVLERSWFDLFLPQRDRAVVRELFAEILGGRRVRHYVNPIVTQDGRELEIEWNADVVPSPDNGSVVVLAVGVDISESRRAEAMLRSNQSRLAAMVDAVDDAIVGLDASGRIVVANSSTARLFRWPGDELIGRPIDVLVPEPAMPGGGRKTLARRRDGSEFYCEVSEAPMTGDPDMALVLVLRDVSQREMLAAKLAHAERLAVAGEIAASVAHEVNTPINSVLNCAQLLADGENDPTLLTDILTEGARIAEIVRGLLDFVRDEEEKVRVAHVGEVVQRTLTLLHRQLKKTGVEIAIDLPRDLPPVRCSPHQLQQVLTNLLMNAKDALAKLPAEARKRIEITGETRPCDACEGEPDCVHLRVKDNGPGIPENRLTRVFEPFYTTKRAEGGSGLGLSVSLGIVQAHGGRMRVESALGEYAEFLVDLPAAHPGEIVDGHVVEARG